MTTKIHADTLTQAESEFASQEGNATYDHSSCREPEELGKKIVRFHKILENFKQI